ncbi:MAG: Obg family GTPase CgtA, partial [Sulfobacillus sp.]
RGGRGNARFKGPTQRAPRIAERGEPGAHGSFVLELRILADVGLVGEPNAGKSSLLAALTRATPKVADYPFTTLHPELGMMDEGGGQALLADLPGLIEGAAEGRGLGHDFLRHVSRTRLLLQVVDVGTASAAAAKASITQIEAELAAFDPELAARPRLVFLNKLDLTGADQVAAAVSQWLADRGLEALSGSAATGLGLGALKERLIRQLAQLPKPVPLAVEARPQVLATAFVVRQDEGGTRVIGQTVERRVAMTDMQNPEAVQRLANYLRRKGVERALAAIGLTSGAEVQVADVTLIYRPDLVIPRRRAGKAVARHEDAAP